MPRFPIPSQTPTPSILTYEPFRALDLLDEVIHLDVMHPTHLELLSRLDNLVPCDRAGTALSDGIQDQGKAKPKGVSLEKLPAEVRLQIFKDVAATKWRRSLLVALRSTHKESTLYEEALQAYYEVNLCIISKSNEPYNKNISAQTQQLVRFLKIDFDTVKNLITTGQVLGRFIYALDRAARAATTRQYATSPVFIGRIIPKLTFNTMAGFTNIKFLHLNAHSICETLIHEIEGMVRKAVQTCGKLERVEVTSDYSSYQHQVIGIISGANDKWVARLNQGMQVRGKLMEVNAGGNKWHWFWQAPDLEKLTWKEREEEVRITTETKHEYPKS